MAYLLQDDEEDKQQQQQVAPGAASGGGGFVQGGGVGGGAPVAAQSQQTPQQKAGSGTGFVNLQSWLNAGKGRDQNISQTGGKLLSGEQATFNKAADPLRKATFTPTTMSDNDVNTEVFDNSGGSLNKLKGVLGQKYTGPRDINYSLDNKNLHGLDALSATRTAGAQLAGATPYSAGARRLDNTLFGADTASQAAIAGNKKAGTKFIGDTKKEVGDLGTKVKGFDKSAEDARAAIRAQLERTGNTTLGAIDARVRAANEADIATQAKLNDAVDASKIKRTITQGTGATAENMVTTREARGLERLAALIGGPTIRKTADYTPWAIRDEALPPDPVAEVTAARMSDEDPYVSPYTGQATDPVAKAQQTTDKVHAEETLNAAIKAGVYGRGAAADGTTGLTDPDTGQVISVRDVMNGKYVWDPATKRLKKVGE